LLEVPFLPPPAEIECDKKTAFQDIGEARKRGGGHRVKRTIVTRRVLHGAAVVTQQSGVCTAARVCVRVSEECGVNLTG